MDRVKRFLPLAVLLAFVALIFGMGWNRYLSLDTLREHGETFRVLARDHYVLTLLALMAAFALMTASMIPGVVFITVTAGYLFGPWVGGVATSAAATVGALGIYYVGRSAMGQALRRKAESQAGLLQTICEGIDRSTFRYVLVARLVVTVPFHLINLAAGVISAPLKPYVVATFVGLLPAHTIYCWIGAGLNEILADDPDPNLQEMFAQFMWPLIGVGFLSLLLPLALRGVQAWRARHTPLGGGAG